LKPEWWGSPLAQEEKYQGRKKTCDTRTPTIIIIIIIIIWNAGLLKHDEGDIDAATASLPQSFQKYSDGVHERGTMKSVAHSFNSTHLKGDISLSLNMLRS
jgi:hypothetical protein